MARNKIKTYLCMREGGGREEFMQFSINLFFCICDILNNNNLIAKKK